MLNFEELQDYERERGERETLYSGRYLEYTWELGSYFLN
jgi:hypothetical protein